MIQTVGMVFRVLDKTKRLINVIVAKKGGLKLGLNTILVGSQSFGTEPYLIEIGENCLITDGVKFITHDGAIQVPLIAAGGEIKNIYSRKSTFGRIQIGSNVFIGISSIILPNTIIGDNSIVAAGSVVKGVFPSGVVLAGQPAKIIGNIKDYYDKNYNKILNINSEILRKDQILQHLSEARK